MEVGKPAAGSTPIRLIIIHVLPDPPAREIRDIRRPVCHQYHDLWALSYPPHLTLRTGVLVPQREMSSFLREFGALLRDQDPFLLRTDRARLKSMSYEGRRKNLLYLPVIKDEPLASLNQRLLGYTPYRKSRKRRFEPHITLFWGPLDGGQKRDMRSLMDARKDLFGVSREWMLTSVSLYFQLGARWEPFHVYKLDHRAS